MDALIDFLGKYADYFVGLTIAFAIYCLYRFASLEARRIKILKRIKKEGRFSEKAVLRRYKKIRAIRRKREQQKRRQRRE
jgi:hypothetical protein